MKQTIGILAIIVLAALQGCYYDKEELLYPSTNCDTTNVTYAGTIAPVVGRNCAISGCHTGPSGSTIGDFSSYATFKTFLDASKDRLVGAINHQPGFSAMPKAANKLDPCTINKIQVWIAGGYPNN